MTPGVDSLNPQTLVAKAKFDCRIIRAEKLTTPVITIEQLLQQVRELLDLSKYSEAIALLDLILQLQPDCSLALYWRGNSFASLGDYKAAIASYDEALKIKPNYFLARFEKRVLLLFKLISRLVLL